MKELAPHKPWFIEEPTSPDDILGHAAIRKALKPYNVQVATGEACQNRVMFKQMFQVCDWKVHVACIHALFSQGQNFVWPICQSFCSQGEEIEFYCIDCWFWELRVAYKVEISFFIEKMKFANWFRWHYHCYCCQSVVWTENSVRNRASWVDKRFRCVHLLFEFLCVCSVYLRDDIIDSNC